MNATLREWLAAVDALSLRERVAVAAATLIVVWGAWTVLFWDGIEAERDQAAKRLEFARSELMSLGERSSDALASNLEDPDRRVREERDRLVAQVASLDAELSERAEQLITPEQMVGTLRQLLAEQHGLTLDRFELQAPTSALADESDEDGDRQAQAEAETEPDLYKHAVELEWRGGYFETLRYLRAVERLGWSLYWESLDYEVTRYPEARVRLRLFTLSEQEGWIGV